MTASIQCIVFMGYDQLRQLTAGFPSEHFVMAWNSVDLPTLARPTCRQISVSLTTVRKVGVLEGSYIRCRFSSCCLVGPGGFSSPQPASWEAFSSYWQRFVFEAGRVRRGRLKLSTIKQSLPLMV